MNEEKYVNEFSRTMICKYPSILNIKGFNPIDIYKKKYPSILTDYFQITWLDHIKKVMELIFNFMKNTNFQTNVIIMPHKMKLH